MASGKLTRDEQRLRQSMLFNLAQELAYRVRRYNECEDRESSVAKRRKRELHKAIDALAQVYNNRLPDRALAYLCGDEAVERRNKLLGSSGAVVPLKRNGRPSL